MSALSDVLRRTVEEGPLNWEDAIPRKVKETCAEELSWARRSIKYDDENGQFNTFDIENKPTVYATTAILPFEPDPLDTSIINSITTIKRKSPHPYDSAIHITTTFPMFKTQGVEIITKVEWQSWEQRSMDRGSVVISIFKEHASQFEETHTAYRKLG